MIRSWVQAVGDVLTIAGLLVAILGLTWESRARSLPVVSALRERLLQLIGRPRDAAVHVGAASGTVTFRSEAHGFVQVGIDPDSPVSEQIDALSENLDRVRAHVMEVAEAGRRTDREESERRLLGHDQAIAELRQVWDAEHQTDARIATRAMRVELVGLVMALSGALLSAAARLF